MSSSESSSYSSTKEEYEIRVLYGQNGKKVHVQQKKKCMSTRVTIFESVFFVIVLLHTH